MSVIITGMEIPKGCTKCSYLDKEYDSDDTPISICRLLNYSEIDGFSTGERYFDCPLKSVKGLLTEISKCAITYPSEEEKLDEAYNQGLVTAMEIIKEYCEVKENE